MARNESSNIIIQSILDIAIFDSMLDFIGNVLTDSKLGK
jgi:hypothetical protein